MKILQDGIDRKMTPSPASVVLGITPYHYSRLIKRYREHGPLGLNNIA
ncbi:helix-turn-helix domain-containing protein [Providencia rettgeri]|nr:helix-turn-helix domain-containing protein [Providencia rettgeri]MBO8256343.1 helix-turn-helix domain-containing protein [Providencia rettgeri]MBO8260190.1 helix-turn-helix domain-containing protein [Providencia rettgeri]HBK4775093.1 helix-turn-helix domain-containing protein [Providencia rettgeri]HEF8782246.1 helix-turn-helix domain-containing protein [Providencia rettgeri]